MNNSSTIASKLSVIIPVFNGAAYLREAIMSVVNQTIKPLEVIVVDDGSTDHSFELASQFGGNVRTVRQPHTGAAAARNLGISLCKGDFISFLDADDLWLPQKTEIQMNWLRSSNIPAGVFSLMEQFVSPDFTEADVHISRSTLSGTSICTLLISKEHFDQVGEFSVQFFPGEFIDWYSRAREQGLFFHTHPEVLVRRRLHSGNLNRKNTNSSEYAQVVWENLMRARRKNESDTKNA